MKVPEINLHATIRAAGTSAVLIVALGALYGIAALKDMEPWLKVVLACPPSAVIVGGLVWMLSGGEDRTQIEIRDGQRKLVIKNLNVLGQAIARGALEAFPRAPLPRPAGEIGPGSPADEANIVEGRVSLPPMVEVAETPMDLPPDAKRLP